MTAVFKVSNSGGLQNFQFGIVDAVATASAARTAWGWLGAFQGLHHALRLAGFRSNNSTDVFRAPSNLPLTCQVLTFDGLVGWMDEIEEAFGGDPTLQMVGLTLCALAHEINKQQALDLFMTYLAPKRFKHLMKDIPGAREALFTQLEDNFLLITNEGAARGLTQKFDSAVEALAGVFTSWKQDKKTDMYLVGGLLTWIGLGEKKPYFTRSALVLRISAYLKAVGYALGTISTWSGHGPPPNSPRAVFLVLGGVSSTDPHADTGETESSSTHKHLVSHYRYSTVGSMLLNTLNNPGERRPEALQEYFDSIENDIHNGMISTWTVRGNGTEHEYHVVAKAVYKKGPRPCPSIAMRLSAFYFARCADVFAPFYQRIADQVTLDIVSKHLNDRGTYEHNQRLIEFRVLTISIILAVVGHFGGPDYKNIRHSTSLSLEKPQVIRDLAKRVETLLVDGLTFSKLAGFIAYCHTGIFSLELIQDFDYDETLDPHSTQVIGFRNGTYAVIPALLSNMKAGPRLCALGFQCFDEFIMNVPVYPNGSIKSCSKHIANLELYSQIPSETLLLEGRGQKDNFPTTESAWPQVTSAVPSPQPPDIPLHLSIERPLGVQGPTLGISGRVGGSAIGNVGVPQVLRNIIRSFENKHTNRPHHCRRELASSNSVHTTSAQPMKKCRIFPASIWIRYNPGDEIVGAVYVPVRHDSAWGIYLAGMHPESSLICLCCSDCTIEAWAGSSTEMYAAEESNLIIIGYHSDELDSKSVPLYGV